MLYVELFIVEIYVIRIQKIVCLYMRPFSEFVQIQKMKTYAVNGNGLWVNIPMTHVTRPKL